MELSYLIQSLKFSWAWSQSRQRIANKWNVIDPLLVSKAMCNWSWPCGSKANELFHNRYTPQSTKRHFHFMRIAIVQSRKEARRNPQVRRCLRYSNRMVGL